MWIAGDLMLFASVLLVAAAWMRHDRVVTERLDRRLDAEREARTSG